MCGAPGWFAMGGPPMVRTMLSEPSVHAVLIIAAEEDM